MIKLCQKLLVNITDKNFISRKMHYFRLTKEPLLFQLQDWKYTFKVQSAHVRSHYNNKFYENDCITNVML